MAGRGASTRPVPADFSLARTHQVAHDPLPLLLGAYEEHGPIFSMRLLHTRVVFMLGPEANHFITVAHPENFHWRESSFGDLIPLLGDGLLTIDDDYHDRARAIMMPAFHREQLVPMSRRWRSRRRRRSAHCARRDVDVYDWMRNLAMRIAMRALLGLDPDEAGKGAAAAEHFERALGFYGIDYPLRLLRGPGSPWRKMNASRAVLDEIVFGEIAAAAPRPTPSRRDILSLLLGARGEGGEAFTDREVRDQVMTLMFAGHDTSTSTLDLHDARARSPPRRPRQALRGAGSGARWGDAHVEQLEREMPYLEMVLDEVLRLYPPAWIGPRRAVREFEFGGYTVPRAPTSTTAPGPATASRRSSPTPRRSSRSASPASARRRCPAAPTSPSAAASGSASANASARPR